MKQYTYANLEMWEMLCVHFNYDFMIVISALKYEVILVFNNLIIDSILKLLFSIPEVVSSHPTHYMKIGKNSTEVIIGSSNVKKL